MKKTLLFLILSAFIATSIAEAAPARKASSTRGGGGSNVKATTAKKSSGTKATQKASAKKTTKKVAKRTKARSGLTQLGAQQRGREEQLGLMPSEIDFLNHNVYHAAADAIRGARETEQALRYLPFVTITNTSGFGSQFDIRGQGRLASNGVKMYINGVPANPVDSYYGFMPINTIIPSLIQEIEVHPGSGAVLYGSGTKGGTINVITSKRQNAYFMVGGGYLNARSTNSFNAFAHAAEKFGTVGLNAGVAYNQIGGPRDDDKQQNAQGVLGTTVPLGIGSQIDLDVDFYYGNRKSTPYNTLVDEAGVRNAMLNIAFNDTTSGAGGWDEAGRQNAVLTLPSLEPSKADRGKGGLGEVDTTQMRINGSLAYTADLAQRLQWNLTGLFSLDNRKFNTYSVHTPVFVLGGTDTTTFAKANSWYVMRPLPQSFANKDSINPIVDGVTGEYPYLDLSGSSFNELKGGAKTEFTWKHGNGELIFGLSGLYEKSKRNVKSYLRTSIPWIHGFTDGGIGHTGWFRASEATLDDNMDITAITAAVYLYERYRMGQNFSIAGGARYEMKNYDVKVADHYQANRIVMQMNDGTYAQKSGVTYTDYYVVGGDNFIRDLYSNSSDPINNPTHNYKQNHDNFTFELSPVLNYSNTGLVYLHGEFGYITPPAWAMVQRYGRFLTGGYGTNPNPNTTATDPNDTTTPNANRYTLNFKYRDTDLKSETYWTAELGWKETIVNRQVPLGFMNLDINALLFSISAFYTDSKNEFFFDGDTYSGMSFGNYDKSRRIGAEVALEQIILGNVISLNESFTYIKAEYKEGDDKWATIPYTYDYKATLGAALDVSGFVEIVNVGFSVWLQNSLYGNQQVPTREVTAQGTGIGVTYTIGETTTKKLKPYLISDLGISLSLSKNLITLTAGVKNVFDTFYYDYYNNDKAAVINENRFLIGRGRTVFVEGVFKY